MNLCRSCGFAALALVVGLTSEARAWSKAGHMATGAIAYDVLMRDSPDTVRKVVQLLKEHPYYELRWKRLLADVPNEADQNRILFMMAARWPDDARGDEEFHHAEWHYVNFPFKPPGQPSSVRTRREDPENILRAAAWNTDLLRQPGTDDEAVDARAVAMCWMFHLIGDVHQPLHTATIFTREFRQGDRGGTRFYIRAREGGSAISLHKYWDDLIGTSERFRTVQGRAKRLLEAPEHKRSALEADLRVTSFDRWAVESVKLAKTVAYRNGDLEGRANRADAVALPDDYAAQAQSVANRRAVLAGYRLAAFLKANVD